MTFSFHTCRKSCDVVVLLVVAVEVILRDPVGQGDRRRLRLAGCLQFYALQQLVHLQPVSLGLGRAENFTFGILRRFVWPVFCRMAEWHVMSEHVQSG